MHPYIHTNTWLHGNNMASCDELTFDGLSARNGRRHRAWSVSLKAIELIMKMDVILFIVHIWQSRKLFFIIFFLLLFVPGILMQRELSWGIVFCVLLFSSKSTVEKITFCLLYFLFSTYICLFVGLSFFLSSFPKFQYKAWDKRTIVTCNWVKVSILKDMCFPQVSTTQTKKGPQ